MELLILAILFLLALLTASFVVTQLLALIAKNKFSVTEKFTELIGGTIHWIDAGKGETLVLLHGLGGNHNNIFTYFQDKAANTVL